MKTATDLFIAFTSNRKPDIINGDDVCFPKAKYYMISQKQSNWLCSLIFNHVSKTCKNGSLNSTRQYTDTINGVGYTLIQGKKTHRIRVWEAS